MEARKVIFISIWLRTPQLQCLCLFSQPLCLSRFKPIRVCSFLSFFLFFFSFWRWEKNNRGLFRSSEIKGHWGSWNNKEVTETGFRGVTDLREFWLDASLGREKCGAWLCSGFLRRPSNSFLLTCLQRGKHPETLAGRTR